MYAINHFFELTLRVTLLVLGQWRTFDIEKMEFTMFDYISVYVADILAQWRKAYAIRLLRYEEEM